MGRGEVDVGEPISIAFCTRDHPSASRHHLLAPLLCVLLFPKDTRSLKNTAFSEVQIVFCDQTRMTLFELTMQEPAGETSVKAN